MECDDLAEAIEALKQERRDRYGSDRVLGPYVVGISKSYDCGCLHSVEHHLFRCEAGHEYPEGYPDDAKVRT